MVVSAPTSFGKSLLIEEIVASGIYKNIVIIQPTLALLDETRVRLKKYDSNYKLIVRTSQIYAEDKGNIFLLTAERVLEYDHLPQIDLLILDEFYKLSNMRNDTRADILNNAFLRVMKNSECKFYLLGPNIDDVSHGFLEKYNARFIKTNYSLVRTEVEDRFEQVKIKQYGGKVEEEDLFKVLDGLDNQTLVFCSSPNTARSLAFKYCNHLKKNGKNGENDVPLISWIESNLGYNWTLTECLKYKIAVHDGALQKHITTSIIQYFNDRKIDVLFCTNTIIEGVNTSAKYVVYYDNKIGKKEIDYFDYSNIRGRAGRLMQHYSGTIINLKKPPQKSNYIVEIPLIKQNPISDEILVNIPESDIKDIGHNRNRYNNFKQLDSELQEILKRNAVSISGQLKILRQLQYDIESNNPYLLSLIKWTGIDGLLYKRLEYIFNLCWDNLSENNESELPRSQKWIVNKTAGYCFNNSLGKLIDEELAYRIKDYCNKNEESYISINQALKSHPEQIQNIIDTTFEVMFKLQKNWFQYKIPKWINVVDSLQKYILNKKQQQAGNYLYVSEMIENGFINNNLRILFEYGVPESAILKIQQVYIKDIFLLAEEEVINFIKKNRESIFSILTKYECDTLVRAL